MVLNNILLYSIIFALGMCFSKVLMNLRDNIEETRKSKKMNILFSEILASIGRSKLVTRVNNTATISIVTGSLGSVNLVYMIDRQDIAIFQENKCIYTSEMVDSEIISSIIEAIVIRHGKNIDDVVNLFGFLFSKFDFEKKFKMKIENGMLYPLDKDSESVSDIVKIVKDNSDKFSIDDILDKINTVGIDNLSIEEKKFLKSYKM